MQNIAYFTICSANYLAYALTLAQSLHEVEPTCKLHVFLADRLSTDSRSGAIQRHHIHEKAVQRALHMAVRHAGMVKRARLKLALKPPILFGPL